MSSLRENFGTMNIERKRAAGSKSEIKFRVCFALSSLRPSFLMDFSKSNYLKPRIPVPIINDAKDDATKRCDHEDSVGQGAQIQHYSNPSSLPVPIGAQRLLVGRAVRILRTCLPYVIEDLLLILI